MTDSRAKVPLFPRPRSVPLALVPDRVHATAVVSVLNRVLGDALRNGELDFLHGRTVHIRVRDMQLGFCITLQGGRLAASRTRLMAELTISGTLHAFLLLAARREDADTLFSQHRLCMEGDTELALEIRNFLDGLDVDARWLPRQVSRLAHLALPLYERTRG